MAQNKTGNNPLYEAAVGRAKVKCKILPATHMMYHESWGVNDQAQKTEPTLESASWTDSSNTLQTSEAIEPCLIDSNLHTYATINRNDTQNSFKIDFDIHAYAPAFSHGHPALAPMDGNGIAGTDLQSLGLADVIIVGDNISNFHPARRNAHNGIYGLATSNGGASGNGNSYFEKNDTQFHTNDTSLTQLHDNLTQSDYISLKSEICQLSANPSLVNVSYNGNSNNVLTFAVNRGKLGTEDYAVPNMTTSYAHVGRLNSYWRLRNYNAETSLSKPSKASCGVLGKEHYAEAHIADNTNDGFENGDVIFNNSVAYSRYSKKYCSPEVQATGAYINDPYGSYEYIHFQDQTIHAAQNYQAECHHTGSAPFDIYQPRVRQAYLSHPLIFDVVKKVTENKPDTKGYEQVESLSGVVHVKHNYKIKRSWKMIAVVDDMRKQAIEMQLEVIMKYPVFFQPDADLADNFVPRTKSGTTIWNSGGRGPSMYWCRVKDFSGFKKITTAGARQSDHNLYEVSFTLTECI